MIHEKFSPQMKTILKHEDKVNIVLENACSPLTNYYYLVLQPTIKYYSAFLEIDFYKSCKNYRYNFFF